MSDAIPPNYQLHPADAMLHVAHLTDLHATVLDHRHADTTLLQTRWALIHRGPVWVLYRRSADDLPGGQPCLLERGYMLHCTYTLQEGPADLELRTARQLLEACHVE
jgi:hypothetical protein